MPWQHPRVFKLNIHIFFMVYLTTLSAAQTVQWHITGWWMDRLTDRRKCDRNLLWSNLKYRHLPGRTEEYHESLCHISRSSAEMWNRQYRALTTGLRRQASFMSLTSNCITRSMQNTVCSYITHVMTRNEQKWQTLQAVECGWPASLTVHFVSVSDRVSQPGFRERLWLK
jgi:ribosomal protein S17E